MNLDTGNFVVHVFCVACFVSYMCADHVGASCRPQLKGGASSVAVDARRPSPQADMSAAEIKDQIHASNAFLQSQAQHASAGAQDACAQGMSRSISLQIAALGDLSVQEASELNSAIAESSFCREHKESMATAVSERMQSVAAGQASAKGRVTQQLLNPQGFLTADEWQILESNSKSSAEKIVTLADRLSLLQCINPSEETVRRCVCLLAFFHNPRADPSELYAIGQGLKEAVKARRFKGGSKGLQDYPSSASGLPHELAARAYSAQNPAMPRDVRTSSTNAPARSNHSALAVLGISLVRAIALASRLGHACFCF